MLTVCVWCSSSDVQAAETDGFDLTTLRTLISVEQQQQQQQGGEEGAADESGGRITVARGLRAFDPAVHRDLARLPLMVLQQYVEPVLSYEDCAPSPDQSIGDADMWGDDSVRRQSTDTSGVQEEAGPPVTPLREAVQQAAGEAAGEAAGVVEGDRGEGGAVEEADARVPHLIVLMHGYMGDSSDMRLLRNQLQTLLRLDAAVDSTYIKVPLLI